MKLFIVFSLVAALFLFFIYVLSDENIEVNYSDYEEASKNGVVPPDAWLPVFLPKSATDIKERHNIDTNETWVFFKYKEIDKTELIKACVVLSIDKVIFPRSDRSFVISWWEDLSETTFNFFQCEQNSFLAIKNNSHEAYFWRLAR
jgi:hypothetical protein